MTLTTLWSCHSVFPTMSVAADRCAHWQTDWGAGQTHCRQCRKNAMFPPPIIKSKSGSVAVTGVLAFLQRVRRHLSCVADCSGGNASAGNIFLAAMHSNPTAWGDTYERARQLCPFSSLKSRAGSGPCTSRRLKAC